MKYNGIINPTGVYKDINTLPFQELMGILKNAEMKMLLQKNIEQEDAMQANKSIALKQTQGDF